MNTVPQRTVESQVRSLVSAGGKWTVSQLAERIGGGEEVKHGQLKHQITQALHRLRRKKLVTVKGLNWSWS